MFYCQFPLGCSYSTSQRSCIHQHHIQSKELKGNNKKSNLIYLCPNHYSCIYIPESKKGIHSIIHENSIILLSIKQSSQGKVIEYMFPDNDSIASLNRKEIYYTLLTPVLTHLNS